MARIDTAEATKRQADARVAHAQEDHEQSRRDLARSEALARQSVLSTQMLEQARNAETTSRQELEAAKFSALAAASEVKVARAGLVGLDTSNTPHTIISLRSPLAGGVLRVVEKSERVVPAGAPVLVLGDPSKIEVVTDVLTTDAVNVKPGAPVFLEGWGGDHPIRASVRLIEPSGFTKISALGVEEKRVNVIAEFVDSPDGLADGYRVEVAEPFVQGHRGGTPREMRAACPSGALQPPSAGPRVARSSLLLGPGSMPTAVLFERDAHIASRFPSYSKDLETDT